MDIPKQLPPASEWSKGQQHLFYESWFLHHSRRCTLKEFYKERTGLDPDDDPMFDPVPVFSMKQKPSPVETTSEHRSRFASLATFSAPTAFATTCVQSVAARVKPGAQNHISGVSSVMALFPTGVWTINDRSCRQNYTVFLL